MFVTCPQCDNLIEAAARGQEPIQCDSCGSSFRTDDVSTMTTIADLRALGKFQLLNRVGAGAFGVVWRARDTELDRVVALKTLRTGLIGAEASRERFYREARAAAQLRHPGIVTVYEVKELDGVPTIVAEFVEGMTLRDLLSGRRLSFRQTAELIAMVAEALDYAHSAGLVHRDIKPANIMIEFPRGAGPVLIGESRDRSSSDTAPASSSGSRADLSLHPLTSLRVRPLLLDFGLVLREQAEATMTIDGQVLGTPAYMSPEQASGQSHVADRRSDIYSLGVVMYELLTGGVPFRGTHVAIAQQVIHDDPRPPRRINHRIPRDMETITLKAMAKEPHRRYQSAVALAEDLRAFLRGDPISARPAGAVERSWRAIRRNRLIAALTFAVASLLIVLAAGASALAIWQRQVASRERVAREEQAALRSAAETAREIAAKKAEESRRQLVRHFVSTGLERLADADLLKATYWFVEALREDQTDPVQQQLHRIRIASVLRHSPKLHQVWFHDESVVHSEFNRRGDRVVTASFDNTARVWSVETGEAVTAPLRHDGPVLHATFSPDGLLVLTSSDDGTARLWDSSSGTLIRVVRHAARVQRSAFSPDGKWIATASFDKTARVWNTQDGQAVSPALEHNDRLQYVAFSPDGRRVVTASDDSTARVWDASTGQAVTEPLRHVSQLHSAVFSPDGRLVLTASNDHSARVFDSHNGKPVGRPMRHHGQVTHAAFSPDGRRAVTSSTDETARIWDTETGELIAPVMRHNAHVRHACFSPDGQSVLTTSGDGSVRVWEIRTGEPITPPLRQTADVAYAEFSRDGQRIVASSFGRSVYVWDLATSNSSMPRFHHGGMVTFAVFSPSGRRVATASTDRTARVWDADTGDPVTPAMEHPFAVNSVIFSPDGRQVVTSCGGPYGNSERGEARIWDVASGTLATAPLNHTASVRYAEFSSDGQFVVTASADSTARVWDAVTGEPIAPPLPHQHWVYHATFNPDGTQVATASFDQTSRVWHTKTGEPVTPPLIHEAGMTSYHVAFSHSGRYLATANSSQMGQLGSIRIWNLETAQPLSSIRPNSVYLFRTQFSPDDRSLLVLGGDRGSAIWSLDGIRRTPTLDHSGTVSHGSFSGDGRLVATASWDKTARVWDALTGLPLTPPLIHGNEVQHAEFSPDSRRLITASSDGTARIWSLEPDNRPTEDLLALAGLLGADYDETEESRGNLPRLWQRLRSRYPLDFRATIAEIQAWHRAQAHDAELARDWAAVVFHLDRLIGTPADNESLRARLDRAALQLGKPTPTQPR